MVIVVVFSGLYFNGYLFVCYIIICVGILYVDNVVDFGIIWGEVFFEFMWLYMFLLLCLID